MTHWVAHCLEFAVTFLSTVIKNDCRQDPRSLGVECRVHYLPWSSWKGESRRQIPVGRKCETVVQTFVMGRKFLHPQVSYKSENKFMFQMLIPQEINVVVCRVDISLRTGKPRKGLQTLYLIESEKLLRRTTCRCDTGSSDLPFYLVFSKQEGLRQFHSRDHYRYQDSLVYKKIRPLSPYFSKHNPRR